jgi:hypothetical protein
MTPIAALIYSFLFGLLHGILPDEHTWPITFSYAIGGAGEREGMKAGLYFSAAFTVQRALLSELAYLALAPFLLSPTINGLVYVVVGLAMAIAGAIVLRRNHYPHLHVLGRCRGEECEMETGSPTAPPPHWTIIHGFIAGFGFGGFSLFVNTVAAPAMSSPWLGFLPGLVFGLGTMIILVIVGALFGASLRWARSLTPREVSGSEPRQVGARCSSADCFSGPLEW